MKIDINENAKIVALWFTNQENPQENLPLDIEKEIEIYRMIWSSISDSTKRVIDLFENEDMKDEKYIVIEYL